MGFRSWYNTQKVGVQVAVVGGVLTIVSGVVAGVFGIVDVELAKPGSQPPTSAPTATRTTSAPATVTPSSGVLIPVSPASRLYDPDSTGVYGVAFSRSGTLAAGDLNGSAYLWDVDKDKVTGTFPDSNGESIFGVALSPDGTMLAASTVNVHDGYRNGSIVLWNTSSGKLIDTLNAPNGRAFGAAPARVQPGR